MFFQHVHLQVNVNEGCAYLVIQLVLASDEVQHPVVLLVDQEVGLDQGLVVWLGEGDLVVLLETLEPAHVVVVDVVESLEVLLVRLS